MYRLALWLIPAVASCHCLRYARVGEFDGKAEAQIEAADPFQPVLRNMPLPEGVRVQTAAGSHAEIELDEGGVVRLAPETLVELSDYTCLSSGQRVTLVSVDHGMIYFTGQAGAQETLMLAVPGAQVTARRGTRLRLEARDGWSQIAAIEGKVRFASPSAEMDLREGEMARVDPANRSKFYLYREIAAYDSDAWSEARDKALASPVSAAHVPELHYGVQELDAAGSWIETQNFGTVWKPKTNDGWTPFRDGKWIWYEGLGFTWVAGESWGWLPYHYGRWMRTAESGWFWTPGKRRVFKPGDVYWLRGAKVAGWGPLAPEEEWMAAGVPQLYLNASTTWAEFPAEARAIDPAGFTSRPKEPLAVASFVPAPPSPAFPASRLEATRPPLRTGAVRILPVISGVVYEEPVAQAPPPAAPPPISAPPDAPPPAGPPPPVVVAIPPPELPVEVYYPAPVYTGVVVINPPEKASGGGNRGKRTAPAATSPTLPSASPAAPRGMAEPPRAPRSIEPKPPAAPRDEPKREHPPAVVVKSDPAREITRGSAPSAPVSSRENQGEKADNSDRTIRK